MGPDDAVTRALRSWGWVFKYGGIALALWIAFGMAEKAMEGLRAQGRAEVCEQIGWRHPVCWRGKP